MSGMDVDIENLSKMTEAQKIAFLHIFVKMACIDGVFEEREKEFIRRIAADFEITSEQLDEIMNHLDKDEVVKDAALIQDRSVALELIKEMCLLAHADDDLSDEEVLFIGEVGQAMGIELEKIEQISNWVIDYLLWVNQGKIIFETC